MNRSDILVEHPADQGDAKQARRALEALRQGRPITGDAAAPPAANAAIERVLETMADGIGVAVIALDAELTTQEAADLLGVSRSTLIEFLDESALPPRMPGRHRRFGVAEILEWRARRRQQQEAMLHELVAANQRAGLYEE